MSGVAPRRGRRGRGSDGLRSLRRVFGEGGADAPDQGDAVGAKYSAVVWRTWSLRRLNSLLAQKANICYFAIIFDISHTIRQFAYRRACLMPGELVNGPLDEMGNLANSGRFVGSIPKKRILLRNLVQ